MEQRLISLLLAFFISFPFLAQTEEQPVLSEIMFYPIAANSEFIELYNPNSTTVNLKGIAFRYYKSSPDSIISLNSNYELPPYHYAIVFEGDYDLSNGIYSELLPENVHLFFIHDNSFGSSGMANSTDRKVSLINQDNVTSDSLVYSADNKEGFSEERFFENDSLVSNNWENSKRRNGTPGKKNSICPKLYDLSVTFDFHSPQFPLHNEELQFNFTAYNLGIEESHRCYAELFQDTNRDSICQAEELVDIISLQSVPINDSLQFQLKCIPPTKGYEHYIAQIDYPEDEETLNNYSYIEIEVFDDPNSFEDILLSEFMYAPIDDEPEWIELYNKTDRAINLYGWGITDTKSRKTFCNDSVYLPANSFLIIAADSTFPDFYSSESQVIISKFPSLNNSGDKILLSTHTHRIIDSVNYRSTWGGKNGMSLEKIFMNTPGNDSTSWQESYFPTPGSMNSVTPKEYDLSFRKIVMTTPYALVGKEIEFEYIVDNIGLNRADEFTIDIFADTNNDSIPQANEKISEHYVNSIILPNDSLLSSFSLSSFSVGKNHYIFVINFPDDLRSTNNYFYLDIVGIILNETRSDVVINEIMHSPVDDAPEWIELYNTSNKAIELKGYQIADSRDTSVVIFDSHNIIPGEYVVIADDSLYYDYYTTPSYLFISQFPSLNNSGDHIFILDSLNRVIDSLAYKRTWGGTNGFSLEKKEPSFSPIDSISWGSSSSETKSTPGKQNSIVQKDYDLLVGKVELKITKDRNHFGIGVKNVGKKTSTYSLTLSIDENLDSIIDRHIETLSNTSLPPNDSLFNVFKYSVQDLESPAGISIILSSSTDQNSRNDSAYSIFLPCYNRKEIIVNEIMYNPQDGEPEWIELFNNSGKTIEIKNMTLCDLFTTPKEIDLTYDNFQFPSKTFLTISRDSSLFNFHKTIYGKILIAPIPNLNNDIDGIVLKDAYGNLIDSLLFKGKWNDNNCSSLERISITQNSTDSSNWGGSIDSEFSTPGRINSLSIKEYDLVLDSLFTKPEFPTKGETIILNCIVKNRGKNPAVNFSISFYSGTTLLETVEYPFLANSESLYVASATNIEIVDSLILSAVINYKKDRELSNNAQTHRVYAGHHSECLVISEFMPSPEKGKSEWIELYNNSESIINLKNWKLSDLFPTPTGKEIIFTDFLINPNQFLLLSEDTTPFSQNTSAKKIMMKLPSLSNSEDGIILMDHTGKTIDSLRYTSEWPILQGRSCERCSFSISATDSNNWFYSINDCSSSCGMPNSISELCCYSENSLLINEIMFDPEEKCPEFIEFFNNGKIAINPGGFFLYDDNTCAIVLTNKITIEENDFFVVAFDSTFFTAYPELQGCKNIYIPDTRISLSNSKETLRLYDFYSTPLDSCQYRSNWHNKNIYPTKGLSLERISPLLSSNSKSNWSTSVDPSGATPLRENSIYTNKKNTLKSLEISPNPFSPDNDGFEDHTIISYNLSRRLFLACLPLRFWK